MPWVYVQHKSNKYYQDPCHKPYQALFINFILEKLSQILARSSLMQRNPVWDKIDIKPQDKITYKQLSQQNQTSISYPQWDTNGAQDVSSLLPKVYEIKCPLMNPISGTGIVSKFCFLYLAKNKSVKILRYVVSGIMFSLTTCSYLWYLWTNSISAYYCDQALTMSFGPHRE